MAAVNQFDYAKPKLLDEALEILERSENHFLLAGGTDLIDMLKEGIVQPDIVLDVKGIDQLHKITFENNILFIVAAVTFT